MTKIVAANVERLEEQASATPHSFYTVPLEERERKTHLKSTSCAQAVVWLARSLRFAMDFLRNIFVHGDETRVSWAVKMECFSLSFLDVLPNLRVLVLGCIEADFCRKMC